MNPPSPVIRDTSGATGTDSYKPRVIVWETTQEMATIRVATPPSINTKGFPSTIENKRVVYMPQRKLLPFYVVRYDCW